MKRVSALLLALAASSTAETTAEGPAGRYCGEVSLMFAKEHVEIWVNEENDTFDFGATGVMTVPWCPGNTFTKEINPDTGDIQGLPDVTYDDIINYFLEGKPSRN